MYPMLGKGRQMDHCLLTSVADAEQWVRVLEGNNIILTASKLVVEVNEGF